MPDRPSAQKRRTTFDLPPGPSSSSSSSGLHDLTPNANGPAFREIHFTSGQSTQDISASASQQHSQIGVGNGSGSGSGGSGGRPSIGRASSSSVRMALSAGEDEDEDDEDGAGIRNRPMGGGSFRRQQQQQHHRRGGGGALLASLPGGGGGSRPWKSATNDSDTDPAADPDANFFRLENLRGGGSSSEDERPGYGATWSGAGGISVSSSLGAGVGVRKTTILDDTGAVTVATSADGRERMEWQSMLASVLGGEILKGEKSRIGGERPTNETYKREIGDALWWQIRARLRGRSEEEERRRTAERRRRVVDSILEELETFKIEIPDDVKEAGLSPSGLDNNDERQIDGTSDDPEERAAELREAEAEMSAEDYAIEKILITLGKLSLAESLYPHEQAMRAEKPLYDSRDFQARVDAMSAWSTLVRMLHSSLVRLQRWTGSKELDVTQRNTTSERPLQRSSSMAALPVAPIAPSGANGAAAADDSTFIERILKEDSITKIFGKRAMIDLYSVMYMARETVIEHHQMFDKLGLSRFSKGFRGNLVMLCAFPARLIIEALRVRLDAVTKLVDPSVYAIDDMIDNFRQTLHLACQVKERYLQIIEPDESGHWAMPSCVGAEYDAVILDGLRTFFKLLHWKLKSGSKAIYFKETEVLEDEWEFLYTVAEAVEGGDVVVAEHFCSLTNKLMVRVINYFETQLRVPVMRGELQQQHEAAAATAAAPSLPGSRRAMNTDEMLQWFAKILDAVKMRYRKLQRFARRLTQRFDNSAEYAYSPSDIDLIIEALDETDHFLVYTQAYEAEGTYIIADPALRDRPDRIQRILASSFSALTGGGSATAGAASGGGDDSSGEDDPSAMASYLLVFTPRQKFVWPGAMLHLELPFIQLRMGDNRCRLVADGPASRLATCKDAFSQSFLEQDVPFVQLDCIVEQQAHLPQIQRELKKISRSTNRLSECIVESVTHVRAALKGAPGAQELVENWFAFAADHGQRVSTHMDHAAWSRFSRLLMRLAINWVGFVCDQCDPTDRKTFRWAVNALEYAMTMTRGNNILHMEQADFALLRSKVAACMALLISHFDILGARSSIEAKKEADKLEAIRRLQRIQENQDDELRSRPASPQANEDIQARIRKLTADVYGSAATDRSIRLTREARMSMIAELEAARAPPAAVGHVLDETVGEDRSLLFLASSSSNIALRWQQGGFIGGGANGNVYIGFNLDSGGIMAVKEIRVQDLSNSPALYKQIKDESDVMQMLSHPNIVDYYGIEVHRDRVYIFEEYCEGGSLANLLENGRIEDEEIIQVYTIQMLQGLEYLHSKGVEHRDVKPDNILLGANSTIKFVDFGAAKVIVKGNRTMAKTRAFSAAGAGGKVGAGGIDGVPAMNSLAGTPMYMAPEVIKNEKTGRLGAMDIWSMGCVVLEFATGRKPWSNLDNEWAIMFHIGIATKHPPLPEPGELSDVGIDFIELCLTLEPAARPTASELLDHPWLAATQQQIYEVSGGFGDGSGQAGEAWAAADEPLAVVEEDAELEVEEEEMEDEGDDRSGEELNGNEATQTE